MLNIYNMTPAELSEYLDDLPSYKIKQIFKWIYGGVRDFGKMTDISKETRQRLKEDFTAFIPKIKIKQISKDKTVKYLFEMEDGVSVESVVMSYQHGYTICVSSQAGCRMGCGFCASTLNGLERNLLPGEIAGQVIAAGEDLNVRISNIVMMGSGEPLDNFDNVIKFIDIATNPLCMGIGARHITLSTCGLISGIRKLKALKLQINLSLSLHAPNDEIRTKLMPVAKSVPIEELIRECRSYFDETHRRITFEYSLVRGINDSPENAKELCRLLSGGEWMHVNLIPVNEVKETGYKASTMDSAKIFESILRANGINATIRRTLGDDIDAACGQLRNKQTRKE